MRKNPVLLLILLGVVLAFAFATEFVVVMTLTLPTTDGAHGSVPFSDPLVLPVMSMFALPAGLLTSPMLVASLRARPLCPSLLWVAAVPLVAIVLVTPINAGLGFLLSFPAYAAGCALAHRFVTPYPVPGHCPRCGYRLSGHAADSPCPECGNAPTPSR